MFSKFKLKIMLIVKVKILFVTKWSYTCPQSYWLLRFAQLTIFEHVVRSLFNTRVFGVVFAPTILQNYSANGPSEYNSWMMGAQLKFESACTTFQASNCCIPRAPLNEHQVPSNVTTHLEHTVPSKINTLNWAHRHWSSQSVRVTIRSYTWL